MEAEWLIYNCCSEQGEMISTHHFKGNLMSKFFHEQLGNLDYYFIHSTGNYDYSLRADKAVIKM